MDTTTGLPLSTIDVTAITLAAGFICAASVRLFVLRVRARDAQRQAIRRAFIARRMSQASGRTEL